MSGTMSYVTGSHNIKVGALFLQSFRDLYQPFERAISYTFVTNATRVWTDLNGDYVPQENELGPLSNPNFGRSVQTTVYSDEVLHG